MVKGFVVACMLRSVNKVRHFIVEDLSTIREISYGDITPDIPQLQIALLQDDIFRDVYERDVDDLHIELNACNNVFKLEVGDNTLDYDAILNGFCVPDSAPIAFRLHLPVSTVDGVQRCYMGYSVHNDEIHSTDVHIMPFTDDDNLYCTRTVCAMMLLPSLSIWMNRKFSMNEDNRVWSYECPEFSLNLSKDLLEYDNGETVCTNPIDIYNALESKFPPVPSHIGLTSREYAENLTWEERSYE